jgi:hypothetical protein
MIGSRYVEIRRAWRNEAEPHRGGPSRHSHGPPEPPPGYRDGGRGGPPAPGGRGGVGGRTWGATIT